MDGLDKILPIKPLDKINPSLMLKTPQTFNKKCPWCKKAYLSQSRNRKYCSDTCATKDSKKKKETKKAYNANAEVMRLYSRSHSLSVEVVNQLIKLGLIKDECKVCQKKRDEVTLEVHHVDLNWLNNSPDNLDLLCKKHHALFHSELIKELDLKGLILLDHYNQSMIPFHEITAEVKNRIKDANKR